MPTLLALIDEAADTAGSVAPEVVVGAVGGLLVAALGSFVLFRLWRSPFAELLKSAHLGPRLALGAAVGGLAGFGYGLRGGGEEPVLRRVLVLVLIGTITWYLLSLLRAVEHVAVTTWDSPTPHDPHARRRRTQFLVLRRAGSALVVVVALAAALLTFPAARTIGQSLLASAGVIGIVVGVAAQGSLKNLVAGIQIAIAQPIKLGDAVFVNGEWGTVEDITLTTVVVEIWDRRRLVHPTSWFVEQPFQNWTRRSTQLLGQVTLVLDHRTDVPSLRAAAGEAITSHPDWDGDEWVVQVVDATVEGIIVRMLMSAADAASAWQLRCDVRETLLAWLAEHQPTALPRRRLVVRDDPEGHGHEDDRGTDGDRPEVTDRPA